MLTRTLLLSATLAAVACPLAGCDDHPNGGDGGAGDDLSLPQSGDDLATPVDLAPPGPRTFALRGYVNAINGTTTTSVGAAFYDFGPGRCTLTHYGLCDAFRCDDSNADLGGPFHDSNAGAITLGTGTAFTSTLTWTGTAYQSAPAPPGGAFAWDAATAIPVSAAGGPVAAFSATVTMPMPLTAISKPTFGAPIDRSQDLEVSWTGGSHAVNVALLAADRTRGPFVQCIVPASAGSVIVPRAALLQMPAGSATFEVISADVATIPLPDTYLHVAAGNDGGQRGVTFYNDQVTLQ
jgi:hypothetical protein